MPVAFVSGTATVGLADVATHRMGLVNIPELDSASHLKAMLPELEWASAGSMTALQYADLARVTAASLEISDELDAHQWLIRAVDPAALVKAFSAPLVGMEKTRSSLGLVLDDTDAALRKLSGDATAKASRTVKVVNTFALPAYSTADPPRDWQKLVTFGVIRRCSIGAKALAFHGNRHSHKVYFMNLRLSV